jgi:6-phosphogluconolactonase
MQRRYWGQLLGLGLIAIFFAACSAGGDGDGNPPPTGYKYYAYVAGGDSYSKQVYAFAINIATGALTAVAGSPFDAEWGPNFITVDPSGKFAYVGNSSSFYFSDNVSAFSINARTGALTAIAGSPFAAGGMNPHSIKVDPSGKFAYMANAGSNNVSAFSISPATGALTAVAGSPFAATSASGEIAVARIAQ